MEETIKELLKQAPQSAALVFVFILLIRYLTTRDKIGREYDREKEERMAEMLKRSDEEHKYAREQSRIATDRNTATLDRLASATDKNTFEISVLSKSIDRLVSSDHKHKGTA